MEKYLRVLNVTLDYPPPVLGGYGVMCAQVCTWLKQRGHEVLVLTTLPPELGIISADFDEDDGPVPMRRTLRSYWDGSACLDPPFQEALAVEQHNQAQMRDVLTSFHPAVVTFWHMGAMSLGLITTAARLGFPLVFVIGDDWLCYGGWADAWLRWCNEHPERAPAVEQHTGLPTCLPDLGALGIFCFVSAWTKRRAEQIGGWHFPRAEIIFPGLSPTEFPPLIQVPDRPWRWRLLWVGRVIEEKGVETAIHALSYLPTDTMLDIVGPIEPAYRQRLETLAATLGVASQLSFSLASRQQIRQHYQQADVTLFTSMIEHEAFGLVPLEAMASGCPLIATGVGGSSEYCLDGVNCIHVPPGDSAALAHAVRQLAQSRDLLRRLVEGGLRTASAFTLDCQVAGIERAVDRVMPPEEEARKRHDLAVTMGQECRDETRHRPVQQNPEPRAPGNEKKERHERERSPEDHGTEPGMRYPLTKLPEENEVQSRRQEQAACYLANRRRGWSHLCHRRSDQNEPQQAKRQTRGASTPAYLPADGKAALFRFQ